MIFLLLSKGGNNMKLNRQIVCVICTMILLLVACGKENTNNNEKITVESNINREDTSENESEIISSQETESNEEEESSEETESNEEISKSTINKSTSKSCYISKRPVCEYRDKFPEGVCTDFSYFLYGMNEDAPLEAQRYLEEIGISEENKKLIVRIADEEGEDPTHLFFLEFVFNDEGTKRREHYFFSNKNSYEENVNNIDNILEKSDTALYVCTQYYDADNISYDQIIQMGEDQSGLYEIVW